jgi:hypothetical protein
MARAKKSKIKEKSKSTGKRKRRSNEKPKVLGVFDSFAYHARGRIRSP